MKQTYYQYAISRLGSAPVSVKTYAEYASLAKHCGVNMLPRLHGGVPVKSPPASVIIGAIRWDSTPTGPAKTRGVYTFPGGRVTIEYKAGAMHHWSYRSTRYDLFGEDPSHDSMTRHGIAGRHETVLTCNFGFMIHDSAYNRYVTWSRDYPESIGISDYMQTPMLIGVSADITADWMRPDAVIYLHNPQRTAAILEWYDEVCRHCSKGEQVAERTSQMHVYTGLSPIDATNWGL